MGDKQIPQAEKRTRMRREERRADADILDALKHIITDYRLAAKTDPEIQRLLFQSVSEAHDPDATSCIKHHDYAIYTFIRRLIERASLEGHLRPEIDLDAAAWEYMSMILALKYGVMLDLSNEIVLIQEEMSQIWLRGLQVHERSKNLPY